MTQGNSNLSREEQDKLRCLLRKCCIVFAAHKEDYGHTDVITHSIPQVWHLLLENATGQFSLICIRKCESCWIIGFNQEWLGRVQVLGQHPLNFWVWTEELRFCVDYCKLKAVTDKDSHPLARIEEILMVLTKSKYYSMFDLAGGFNIMQSRHQSKSSRICTEHRTRHLSIMLITVVSVQLEQLVALTQACEIAKVQIITLSDSRYAYAVINYFVTLRKQSFLTNSEKSTAHHKLVAPSLEALLLPKTFL